MGYTSKIFTYKKELYKNLPNYDLFIDNFSCFACSQLSFDALIFLAKEPFDTRTKDDYTKLFINVFDINDENDIWEKGGFFLYFQCIGLTFNKVGRKFEGTSDNALKFEARLFGNVSKSIHFMVDQLIKHDYDDIFTNVRKIVEMASLMCIKEKDKIYPELFSVVFDIDKFAEKPRQVVENGKEMQEVLNKDSKIKFDYKQKNSGTIGKSLFGQKITKSKMATQIYREFHPTKANYISNFGTISSHFSHGSTCLIYSIGPEFKGFRLKVLREAIETLNIALIDIIENTSLLNEDERRCLLKMLSRAFEVYRYDWVKFSEQDYTSDNHAFGEEIIAIGKQFDTLVDKYFGLQ